MTDKELEQQDKQEQKEDNKEKRKQTLKVAITSSVCTLLFIIILLLITILCLKNCSPRNNNNTSSSNSSSEPTWTEKDKSLDDVFKTIIEKQLEVDGFAQDEVTSIVAVSYTDTTGTEFSLKIDAYSNTKVYYYRLDNCAYTGFDNFISYILDFDFGTYPCLDGNITISSLDISTETVVNISQSKERHIISKSPTNIKYFSDYHYDVDD